MRRSTLHQLSPVVDDVEVVVMLLKKNKVRDFVDKSGNDSCVLNVLVRDGEDSASVVCWGAAAKLFDDFEEGDIIKISNPSIKAKSKYSLCSTAMFEMHIDANSSQIQPFRGDAKIKNNVPISQDYKTLDSITMEDKGKYINMLVIIGKMYAPSQITTKTGKEVKKRTVSVFDQYSSNFTITFWEDQLKYLRYLEEQDTVIYFENIRISSYKDSLVGTFDSSSTLIKNPRMKEASDLYRWFQSKKLDDVSSKEKYYTISQLYNQDIISGITSHGYTLASLYQTNISDENLIYQKCPKCEKKCKDHSFCENCEMPIEAIPGIMLRLSFADYTGSIDKLYLFDDKAEEFLDTNLSTILSSSEEDMIDLKHKKLWNQYKLTLATQKHFDKVSFTLESIEPINFSEV